MYKDNSLSAKNEVIIGIVAPIGTDKKNFIKKLKAEFEKENFESKTINVADKFLNISPTALPKPLKLYIKMEIFNKIRKKCKAAFGAFISNCIKEERTEDKKIVYIIDQLKNIHEYKILSHIYGRNYIQISLFSNEKERDKHLNEKFNNDYEYNDNLNFKIKFASRAKFFCCDIDEEEISDSIFSSFKQQILPDATHRLMEKDSVELDDCYKNSGQQVSKLFHKSHYFFNLDKNKILDKEINKFMGLLMGNYKEYPDIDEFGMNLAYQASFMSNFPNDEDIRQIGAAILSEHGEVISVASIKSPRGLESANTPLQDKLDIQEGYEKNKREIKKWRNCLNNVNEMDNTCKIKIDKFLKDSLEFHPCTHAEIAAILDAAKMGTSVKNATLYSTTFPCHLCAKDIINAGIKRVVYLEAYPKSKNR